MYWIGKGAEVAVLNSQVVPISQMVLKTGFTIGVSVVPAQPLHLSVFFSQRRQVTFLDSKTGL